MIIDGQALKKNEALSIKILFEFNSMIYINIYNVVFIHQYQPIFFFLSESIIQIINCSIAESKFDFIPELFIVPSSQIKLVNFTIKNLVLNKSSLMTSSHSFTEIINISIHSVYIFDCSVINIIDGTFSVNNIIIYNSGGHFSTFFDLIGSVYFTANNFILKNLAFENNFSRSSYIFYSDYSSELMIQDFAIILNNGINIFNGICKYFSLSDAFLINSSFYNDTIINSYKSGNFFLLNINIQNCVCNSIICIYKSLSFTLINSTINNITNFFSFSNNKYFNSLSQNKFSLFIFSHTSMKISINSSIFTNILYSNVNIFSIYDSIAVFDNVCFANVITDSSSCCIKANSKSHLLISSSSFPHPVSNLKSGSYYPIYADGTFSAQGLPIASQKNAFVYDVKKTIFNTENDEWSQMIFTIFVFILLTLFTLFLLIAFIHDDYLDNQYDYIIL